LTESLRAYGSSDQVKEASLLIAREAYPELLL
jgi:hypothetical protein